VLYAKHLNREGIIYFTFANTITTTRAIQWLIHVGICGRSTVELRHLRYFVAVGEELNFLRAADRLHISQPPLSQQIRDLEIELGVKLFDRSKRQIELTEAGRIFMQEVRLILAHVDRAADLALRASRGQVGQLRVGFMMPQHSRMVAEVFRLFAKEHSNV